MSIDRPRKRIEVIAWGPVGMEDALELIARQAAEGAWPYALLHDARQITWIPSSSEIRRLVSYIETMTRVHGPRGPVAFITANDALFGMTRMFSMLGEGASFMSEVFRDPTEAEQWLNACVS